MSRNRSTIVLAWFLAVAGLASAAMAASSDNKVQTNAAQAFDKLKALAGQWEATSEKGKVNTSYEVVSGGTALLERIKISGESEMLTVYHLDGNRLVLTHYCEAGNQPTMQAEPFDPASNQLHFRFVNATGLASANAGHMHEAVIKLAGTDEFSEDWTWHENGKDGLHVQLQYHRVR